MRHATVTLLLGLLLAPAVAGQDADKATRIKAVERELVAAKAQVRRLEKQLAELRGTKTYTRDEFKQLLDLKSPDEVKEAIGRPRGTEEFAGDVIWRYENLTVDPESGRKDRGASIYFRKVNGYLKAVRFIFLPD